MEVNKFKQKRRRINEEENKFIIRTRQFVIKTVTATALEVILHHIKYTLLHLCVYITLRIVYI